MWFTCCTLFRLCICSPFFSLEKRVTFSSSLLFYSSFKPCFINYCPNTGHFLGVPNLSIQLCSYMPCTGSFYDKIIVMAKIESNLVSANVSSRCLRDNMLPKHLNISNPCVCLFWVAFPSLPWRSIAGLKRVSVLLTGHLLVSPSLSRCA